MIRITDLTRRFGAATAVDGLNLDIAKGELTVLIGTSGSGKSTLLKMINRLIEPNSGTITLNGEDIRHQPPEVLRRRIGYAIQSVGLFPHWSVEKNIAAVPNLLRWPAQRIRDRVTELLDLLHLPDDFRKRYPHELSGGQQQRVGVARALAADPDVLLMDEPFGALDPVTRTSLQTELARIQALSHKTIVLVTHDIDEALGLGQRVVLMHQGRIVQQGRPVDFLRSPANDFVRDFVGKSDAGVRLLGLTQVGERMRAAPADASGDAAGGVPPTEPLRTDNTLREALSQFVTQQVDVLPVVDGAGAVVGSLQASDVLKVPR